jgi:NAD-dependent deacetylase
MKHIVILSGAGISAESGLKTFRDSDGLWEGYDVYDVATPEGWAKNPQLVLDFYNARRNDVLKAKPNKAHQLIAALNATFHTTIITQNIDDLHERGGSTNIIHLHGQITKTRSIRSDTVLYDYKDDIKIGHLAEDGTQLRPHIVWFGEAVPMIEKAASIMATADIVIVIATSLQVYPAAGLLDFVQNDAIIYVIDKVIPPIDNHKIYAIEKVATEGMQILYDKLMG